MSIETHPEAAAISLDPLRRGVVAVLGYGNQGHAHALNLRDSGARVIVGNRPGSARAARACADGFDVTDPREATEAADLVIVALPDEVQPQVFTESIEPRLRPGATLGFIHGFSVHYGLVDPPDGIGVIMVAPKGPGTTLRDLYVRGMGLPSLVAVERENASRSAEFMALAWAAGIGSSRAAIVRTTFADETETDLFGEQAVLCGGLGELIVAAFETLVEAGYPPELAYIECCHEVKQVADLVYAHGPAAMREAISNTAEFGAYAAGPRVVDEHVRQTMRTILAEIRDGGFARRVREDHEAGFPWFEQRRRGAAQHPIEQAGHAVRAMMPWLGRR
jgi:ketol-acid reductoisomerase